MTWRTVLGLVSLAVASAASLSAQEAGEDGAAQELERIRLRLDELERRHADEVDDLRFEIEALEQEAEKLQRRAAQSTAGPNVFNPRITAFGNILARIDDRPVFLDDDPTAERVDDRFNLREVELDVRAAVDPWADAVVIGTFESETPNEFDAAIEEGYLVLKKLPILDQAPAGLRVKVGRFRVDFGRLNRIHTHDMPWMTRPRSYRTFLGEEGFLQNGLAGEFFLPSPGEHSAVGASVAVVDGGGMPLAEDLAASKIAAAGRLHWFQEMGESTTLELGVSGFAGDSDSRLYGGDWTLLWKPPTGGEWRSFLLGGEVFLADLDQTGLDRSPMGAYVWTQLQLDRNLYAGVRYDWAETLEDQDLGTDTYGAFLTYYTSEFLRLRLGFEHAESDVSELDSRDSAFLELNFVFGSHPVEPYWVNR